MPRSVATATPARRRRAVRLGGGKDSNQDFMSWFSIAWFGLGQRVVAASYPERAGADPGIREFAFYCREDQKEMPFPCRGRSYTLIFHFGLLVRRSKAPFICLLICPLICP